MSLLDNFTDTANLALTSHTSDSGHTWTKHASFSTGAATIDSTGTAATHASVNTDVYVSSYAPGTPDYTVIGVFKTPASVPAQGFGILGRFLTAASTGYRFVYTGTQWRAFKYVASTVSTSIASAVTATLAANTTYTLKMVMSGTSIKCYVDGGAYSNFLMFNITDSSVTADGSAGLYFLSSVNGVVLDQITADVNAFTVLSLDNPDYDVLQAALGAGNAGNLAVGGKIPTGATSIELKFQNGATLVQDWTAVSSLSTAGDTWSGLINAAFTAPAAWLTVSIRCKDGGGTVMSPATTTAPAHLGIGDKLAVVGSSSPYYAFNYAGSVADKAGNAGLYSGTPNPLVSFSADMAVSFHLITQTDCFGGNYWAQEHVARTNRPLALIPLAVGGTTTLSWRSGNSSYKPRYDTIKAQRRVLGVFFQCGSNDAGDSASTPPVNQMFSQADATQRYVDCFADMRTYLGSMGPAGARLPILVCGNQGVATEPSPGDGTGLLQGVWMRIGELTVCANDADNHYLTSQYDKKRESSGTGAHMSQLVADGEQLWAQQNGTFTGQFALGQSITRLRVTDVQPVSATKTRLVYDLGSGFGTGLAIVGGGTSVGGCLMNSDSGSVAVTSAAIVAPNAIEMTHASLAGANRFPSFANVPGVGVGADQLLCVRDNATVPRTAEATKGSCSTRPLTIRATDAASATADLAVNLATIP